MNKFRVKHVAAAMTTFEVTKKLPIQRNLNFLNGYSLLARVTVAFNVDHVYVSALLETAVSSCELCVEAASEIS